MSHPPAKFYLTTAIDYPNSIPHMGHAYEKIVADFYARTYRLRGIKTHFLIGLDEHGQKIEQAAARDSKKPQAFVDEKAQVFRDLYALLNISFDDFIRTSEPRHHAFAGELYEATRANGDIYQGFYEGDYCVSCEKAYTKSELADGKCPVHDLPTSVVREPSYFFRLGKFRDQVRSHIESHPEFIRPVERRNEVLARLADEVLDLSISRSTFHWGIPLPNDPSHVLYVWFDALSNYISALKRPHDVSSAMWPADCHIIGKDILWFHAVIWPSMLLSAGLPLPRQIYAHGFILDHEGKKMSKQLGNVIDPLAVVKEFSVDVLRFYCLRAFSSGLDGKFSLEDLEERYESELGNDLGNLVMRLAKLVTTRLGGRIQTCGYAPDLNHEATVKDYFACADAREHHRSVEALWVHVRRVNAYMNEKQPWKLPDGPDLERVLGNVIEALRVIAHLAEPILPTVSRALATSLGFEISTITSLAAGPASYQVTLGTPLFPRREKPKTATPAPTAGQVAAKPPGNEPKDPFSKLEIRVGRIEVVNDHPNADALYAMTVDLGSEKRSICAGLRQHLSADELRGRKVVVLANLKPAMLRGVESAGMILATDRKDGKVAPVDPGEAPLGELATVDGIPSTPKSKVSISDFEKAPLEIRAGRVTYQGKPLQLGPGHATCDAEDGARVR